MHRDGDERRLLGCGAGEVGEMTKPNWEAFGREIMEAWPEGGVDGFALQDLAVKHRVLVETKFNPAIHSNDWDDFAEPGDLWFLRNYK